MTDSADRNTTCPRCGYDLSGVVAAWRESCPMAGVCSECGLDLDWGETLNPILRMPGWFVENTRTVAWRGAVRTLPRVLFPWRFWSAVRMSLPVVPRRIILFLVLLAACFYATAGVAAALRVYRLRAYPWLAGEIGDYDELIALLFPLAPAASSYESNYLLDLWVAAAATWFLLVRAAYILLPTTLRRAKVLPRHLWRVSAYSLVGFVLLPLVQVPLRAGLDAGVFRWNLVMPPRLSAFVWLCLSPEWFYPVGSALWLTAWWHAATRRYLRLPNAWAVTASLVLLAGLTTLLVLVILQLAGCTDMLNAWFFRGMNPGW